MGRSRPAADAAHADTMLEPGGGGGPRAGSTRFSQPPPSWIAQALAPRVRAAAGLALYVASSERRAEEIGRALRGLAPDLEVLVLPAWDCLPYDRASPAREIMGRRMAVLERLERKPEGPRVLVAPVETLLQRIPPARSLSGAFLQLRQGARLSRDQLAAFAHRAGYVVDDRIDEPGEIAILGEVADVFPPGLEQPIRIVFGPSDDILELRAFDPLSQRSEAALDEVWLGPASEIILEDGDPPHAPGIEHQSAQHYGRLDTVLVRARPALLLEDVKARERARAFDEQVREAYEAQRAFGGDWAPPKAHYQPAAALRRQLQARGVELAAADHVAPIPNFALARNPGGAFSEFIAGQLDGGRRVVVTGLRHELRPVFRALRRGIGRVPETAASWQDVVDAPESSLLAVEADVDAGFDDPAVGVTLICASDVLGGRMAAPGGGAASGLAIDPDLRVGDVVLHEDHGLGVLEALESVEVDGHAMDALRIGYHGGASILAAVHELPRIWRYGAEPEAVSLDRLNTDQWRIRRAALSQEIDETARRLVDEARTRGAATAPPSVPPKSTLARFAARFAYPETADQQAAIAEALADLASGRVMNRLVCGDVGFGKTEVALRAAAAVALSGRQVAVVAPTTVLARQHLETFRRRFAGFGIGIGHLSRLTGAAEAAAVREGLRRGEVRIVVGTHAVAGEAVGFDDLGLVIVDEEQRFGAALKAKLAALSGDAHRLTLTATPIPRTLQLALVGLQEVSVLATPPARRRPIRTFLAPEDPATLRTALLRERRRGGQSFVVTPRIQDIEPAAAQLAELAPELTVRIAHGDLRAEEVDEAMVGFASGDGDVLLATSIIESGLDVPRANTIIVRGAEHFGLAQLHQLRGRVGRGRAQGVAYLFTAASEPPPATRARLSTLLAHDRLGAGLAISARDLDLRGGGELLGDEQAGHVTLIGASLYQQLLARAVALARGETPPPQAAAELNIGVSGRIPDTYVPDPTLRVNLYARVFRAAEIDAVEVIAEELEDRFGACPEPVSTLLALARLRTLARAAGIVRIDAGPKGVALTPEHPDESAPGGLQLSDGRWIWPRANLEGTQLVEALEELLTDLRRGSGRARTAQKRDAGAISAERR